MPYLKSQATQEFKDAVVEIPLQVAHGVLGLLDRNLPAIDAEAEGVDHLDFAELRHC